MLTDEEFREQHKPLKVPASFNEAQNETEQIVFALADLGEGTADEVTRHLTTLAPDKEQKSQAADVHRILTNLYDDGHLAGYEKAGNLVYNLHKITKANDGAVDPDLLAAGMD